MSLATTEQARRRAAEITHALSRADHPDFAAVHAEELARTQRWPECARMSDEELAAYCRQIAAQQQSATLTAHWPDGGSASSDPALPALPQPPGPDHIVAVAGRPDPDPFDFDFCGAEERERLRVLDNWNDPGACWALARLRQFISLPYQVTNAYGSMRWVASNARVADIAAAFAHIADLEGQLREAQELAELLLGAARENGASPDSLKRQDPDLVYEQLPGWLTHEAAAPERWDRLWAQEQAQREAEDDAREIDPDHGKDLDYDDEDGDDAYPGGEYDENDDAQDEDE